MPGVAAAVRGWLALIALGLGLELGFGLGTGPAGGADDLPGPPPMPPPIAREFRAAWVATVGNIDWPSRPGLSADAQRAEARAILDRARRLGLNAVIFQVRTAADALYESSIEPWSAVLTGTQGQNPGYDPLAFWVEEAHARGLLLHAWINPFRARIAGAKVPEAESHISRTRPNLVRSYGSALWLDPGEPEARDLTLRVAADIARRYDIDGLHIDDYFYPYPIADPNHPGRELPFPDDASYAQARASGVTLSQPDWRRDNINRTVEGLFAAVRRERPRALVGISPFGIVRPGIPPGVRGFDQYEKLGADAGLWFASGWCDYLAPQLYWRVDAPEQPFGPLLASWAALNRQNHHLWPGLSISRVGDGPKAYAPTEIARQVALLRESGTATGHVLFSFKALERNRRGLTDELARVTYAAPALVPPTPWLGQDAPPAPRIEVHTGPADGDDPRAVSVGIDLDRPDPAGVFVRVLQIKFGNTWETKILPEGSHLLTRPSLPGEPPAEAVAVRAVDRLGNASAPTVVRVEVAPPSPSTAPQPPRSKP